MTPEQFKEGYKKARFLGEAEDLLKQLGPQQREELLRAMELVKVYTGLDMRQDLYLGILRHLVADWNE